MAVGVRGAFTINNGSGSTTNSVTGTVPSDVEVGDVILVSIIATESTGSFTTVPSGYTLDETHSAAGAWNVFSYTHTVTSIAERGATLTFGYNETRRINGAGVVISGGTLTGFLSSKILETSSSTSSTVATQTSVPAGAMVVAIQNIRRGGTLATSLDWTGTGYTVRASSKSVFSGSIPNLTVEVATKVAGSAGTYGGETVALDLTSVGGNFIFAIPEAISAASAGLSGSGTLSAGTTPAVTRSAALSGSGTLSTTQRLGVARSAALSGAGTLSAVQLLGVVRAVALSGEGTLSASPSPGFTRTAALTGSGTLLASTLGYANGVLSGSGTLSATISGAWLKAAALSGSGTLTAAAVPALQAVGALSGTGTLVAATPAVPVSAALSGAGYLVGHQVQLLRVGSKVVTDLRFSTVRPLRVYRGSDLVFQ